MPNRSAASRARRAAYALAWRAAHPGYDAAWRRAHRALENARSRRCRAIPGWRAAHEPSRATSPLPIPTLHTGHPLFEAARALVVDRSGLTTLRDPLPEDLRSEAVLAMLEGRDPAAAVARYRSREVSWGRVTCEIPAWR